MKSLLHIGGFICIALGVAAAVMAVPRMSGYSFAAIAGEFIVYGGLVALGLGCWWLARRVT